MKETEPYSNAVNESKPVKLVSSAVSNFQAKAPVINNKTFEEEELAESCIVQPRTAALQSYKWIDGLTNTSVKINLASYSGLNSRKRDRFRFKG